MRFALAIFVAAVFLGPSLSAAAQDSKPAAPASKAAPDAAANKGAEAELQKALADAGNDSAALVRNLTDYLARFPDAPRRPGIYRALIEACQQTRNDACALDYAERLIAIRPEDSQMMLLAVSLLEKKGDDASLTRAAGYVTRVLDRVEKAAPDDKPAEESLADFKDGQKQLRAALYYTRGRIENSRHDYGIAAKDFQLSDSIYPNALATEKLGEIAEIRSDPKTAIEEYTRAFALPESGPAGSVDRRDVRRKLGNVWRQVHGSEQGLGDAILAAYDRASQAPTSSGPDPAARNKDARDFFAFVVRRLEGTPLALAPLKGKIVVLSFWATWCGPCRALEPLFSRVAKNYAGNSNVAFLSVNTDGDETQVAPFVVREKLEGAVVYADGLDDFMKVDTLPTVLILGRGGEIVYRVGELAPEGFSVSLTSSIQAALGKSQ
jgi:thiol-disulfide isomerase/thioredoxin